MKRRGFLASLLGLAAAPAAAKLPMPAAAPVISAVGQVGRYDGVKIRATPEAARVFSRHLWAEAGRVRRMQSFQRELNSTYSSLLQRVQ